MAKMNPKELLDKSVDAMLSTPNAVVNVLDQNGDGELGIDDIIILAVKTPGVHISRAAFLQKELFKNHPQDVIDKAIATTPAQAGISPKEIAKIADKDGLQLDSETINAIIMCLGVMNGVAGANNAIKGMAKALAIGVEKKLLNMALTKGAFYPLVKSILKWFGIKLTRSVFAGFFKKAIPIVGGVIGGGLTFLAFKPCCYRLKDALQDTMLSNPHHVSTPEEDHIVESICSGEIIDVDIEEENAIHDESFPAL